MRSSSLTLRVLIGAMIWIAVALGAGGYAIFEVYRTSALQQFDQRLESELTLLSVALERSRSDPGALMTSPSFSRVYSGLYWDAERDDGTAFRSRSLWDANLPLELAGPSLEYRDISGPDDQQLRMVSRLLQTPDAEMWRIAVACDLATLSAQTAVFGRSLLIAAGLLALALIAAAVLLLRTALAPLGRLRTAVQAQRQTQAEVIPSAFPSEVAPLVDDLNVMLQTNVRLREKGRLQAANLAHALKTPAAILQNEIDRASGGGDIDLSLARDAVDRIAEAAHRHLSAASPGPEELPPHQVFDAVAALKETVHALRRLFADIEFTASMPERVMLAMTPQDQLEIFGNLLENAGKWARSEVWVSLATEGDTVVFTVEDDGHGVPAEQRDRILVQGVRLDRSVGGSGLGLSIVDDIVRRYDGKISLGSSSLGGLLVRVVLPIGFDASNSKARQTLSTAS